MRQAEVGKPKRAPKVVKRILHATLRAIKGRIAKVKANLRSACWISCSLRKPMDRSCLICKSHRPRARKVRVRLVNDQIINQSRLHDSLEQRFSMDTNNLSQHLDLQSNCISSNHKSLLRSINSRSPSSMLIFSNLTSLQEGRKVSYSLRKPSSSLRIKPCYHSLIHQRHPPKRSKPFSTPMFTLNK